MYNIWKDMLTGHWITESSTDTQYKTILRHETLYVDFQACSSTKDWFSVFHFFKKNLKGTPLAHLHSVHSGIYKKYTSIRKALFKEVEKSQAKFIIIRGYSKGASIGLLFHGDITKNKPNHVIEIDSFVFAPLRIFSWRTPQKYFYLSKSVINRGDIVTHLPPFIFGFKQISLQIKYLGKGFRFPLPKYHSDKNYIKELKAYGTY